MSYTCPPQKRLSESSIFDNIVGLQVIQGGGLTQGNFQLTTSTTEKSNRFFDTGKFSQPYTLDNLSILSTVQAKVINEVNFRIFPNFDETNVLNFVAYGPLSKRFSAAVLNIINHFPAAIESSQIRLDYTTGNTAFNISYDSSEDFTFLQLDASTVKNPFSVDFSKRASINLSSLEFEVSKYRNFTSYYTSYILDTPNGNFSVVDMTGTTSVTAGTLSILVKGNPFSGATSTRQLLVIRPNDFTVNEVFNLELDEIEELLLNRTSYPIYTSEFQVKTESSDGNDFIKYQAVTWPLDGSWNIDIKTPAFTKYLQSLDEIGKSYDLNQTDLLSRFYTTESLKEFDTIDGKVNKTLKIYGRSFDESKKYADSISHMVSVNYNVGDDVPSKLLTNVAETLGWKTNISPVQSDGFLSTLYQQNSSNFPGLSSGVSTDELNYQYYRNLILNSAYLFKSKGTRRAVEFLMNNIGAPEALFEFNEHVYLAGGKYPISNFNALYTTITGGTFTSSLPALDPNNTYRFNGAPYTAFTSSTSIVDVTLTREDYPIDSEGYPKVPQDSDSFYFQKGSGWFESTPQHRSPEIIDSTGSVFTGNSPSVQTSLEPFSYGEKYLNRFRYFPYLGDGFELQKTIDNKKSWIDGQFLRKNSAGNFDAYYQVADDRLLLNVKNVDLFLNPAQALVYDVWYMSNTQNYPIPYSGITKLPETENPFIFENYDSTVINPKPQIKDFFEFKETFWRNMINVRHRQEASDGKTGGYPTLQNIYYKYLTMYNDVGIENNNFSYSAMTKYINGIGDFWIRLVEQFIPASTIWNTGTRIENSIFHRQKFVYRMQRGCLPVDFNILGPQVFGGFAPNDCNTTDVTVNLTYDSNEIQFQIGAILNQVDCGNTLPFVISLQYGFELIIVKNSQTYTLQYSNPSVYQGSNYIINSTDWNDFILQGIGFLMDEFTNISVTANYENNILTLQSQDCIQIQSIDFNLQFINVQFGCL
jgi:hypothetical protein